MRARNLLHEKGGRRHGEGEKGAWNDYCYRMQVRVEAGQVKVVL